MRIKGFSSNLYGWFERYKLDGKEEKIENVINDCAAAGLQALELDPTPEVKRVMDGYGLNVSGGYVGVLLHLPFDKLHVDEAILPLAQRIAEAGAVDLIINADPKGGWNDPLPKLEDEFKRQGENLSRIAEMVKSFGLRVALHNHASSSHNANGDLRSVVHYADESVGLCIDTGWAHTAGQDPIEWIKTYQDKIFCFHLRNQVGTVPTEEIQDGEIQIEKLIRALQEIDYQGWLTFELWHREDTFPKRSMVEAVENSITYIEKILAP